MNTNTITKHDANKNRAQMLEAFWKLSEFNTNSRLEGIKQIENHLNKQQDSDDLNYILKRLIRGLASNRKCSRLGFSCALTELINKHETIKIDDLLALGENEYKINIEREHNKASLTNEEISGAQIATAFLYLCIAQSDRLTDRQTIEKVLKNLNEQWKNTKIKSYLRELYVQSLILIARKVDAKYFSELILPDLIDNEFKQGWKGDDTGKIVVHLLLFTLNSYPNEIQSKLLKRSWSSTSLLLANEAKLYEYLSQSCESLPSLAPFCVELIDYSLKQSNFGEFWIKLIDGKLVCKQEKKKVLAFKLLVHSIKSLDNSNFDLIDTLLSPNLIQTLIKNYTLKTNINGVVHGIFKELIEVLRAKEEEFLGGDKSICVKLAIQLMTTHKNHSQLGDMIHQVLSVSNNYGLSQYFNYMKLLIKSSQVSEDEDSDYNEQSTLLNQISSFIKNDNFLKDDDLLKEILLFLIFNLYCETSDAGNCEITFFRIKNNKFDSIVKDCLFKIVAHLITKNKFDSLFMTIKVFSVKVFNAKKNECSIQLHEKYAKKSNDYKQQFDKIYKLMGDVQRSSDETLKQAFMMIAMYETSRMFDSLKTSVTSISDLCISYEKSLNKSEKEDESDEQPKWIDIILEMLLSLYTINNKHIRNATHLLFKKLLPRLTTNSIDLLIDLLEPETEDDLLIDEDEQMKDDDEESGIEDVSPSSKNSDDESDHVQEIKRRDESSDDDDESDDEDGEDDDANVALDEELKKAVDQALGDAVAREESDQSDLDDDAMMKLDEALASAFKLRKKDKQRDVDVLQFKSKVLDLIHEVFKAQTRIDLIVHSIKPMLGMLLESQKKSNLKLLSQRILSMLNNVKNMRKFSDSKLPNIEDIFELLKYVISISTAHLNGTNTVTEITTFLVRLVQSIAQNDNKQEIENRLISVYTELIENFYTHSEIKVNPAIHQEFLLRFPTYSLPLVNQMIQLSSQSDVKIHKKTVTLGILYQTINSKSFTHVTADEIEKFVKNIFNLFNQIASKIIDEDNVHIKFIDSYLNLVGRVLGLQCIQLNRDLVELFADKLSVLSKDAKIKQAIKSRCLNLIHTCHLRSGTKVENKKESKKAIKRKLNENNESNNEAKQARPS